MKMTKLVLKAGDVIDLINSRSQMTNSNSSRMNTKRTPQKEVLAGIIGNLRQKHYQYKDLSRTVMMTRIIVQLFSRFRENKVKNFRDSHRRWINSCLSRNTNFPSLRVDMDRKIFSLKNIELKSGDQIYNERLFRSKSPPRRNGFQTIDPSKNRGGEKMKVWDDSRSKERIFG